MNWRGESVLARALGSGTCIVAILAATAAAQVTTRVNVGPGGVQANSWSENPSMTADGRYVAFASLASNLVPGDTNGFFDIFVRDLPNGTTERITLGAGGTQANGESRYGFISSDGRFVAFSSTASNLVPGDTNGLRDVFVRDRQSGTTELVSVGTGGIQGNADSDHCWISDDGRFVAFASFASNFVPGDTNGSRDVFVRDRQGGTIELVSVSVGGVPGDRESGDPRLSADGRYVAFWSSATDLVPGDTNARTDTFLRDRLTGTTERVSVGAGGVEGNHPSGGVAGVSLDGRFVAFGSDASNLVSGDTNAEKDIFVRDRQSGTTERVSIGSGGQEGDDTSEGSSISPDGRYVTFSSFATNLVPGDTNLWPDVFLRDRQLGTIERVSLASDGAQGNADAYGSVVSADGRYTASWSLASSLVPGDTNGTWDIFVHDRAHPEFASLCDPGVSGVAGCPCSNAPSGSNRGCDNSASTGGASLAAAGGEYLSCDTVFFTTSGEKPTATSILLQGNALASNGVVYGQGVRCVAGTLKRLYAKGAVGGSITAPNFGAGDPTVSARSAAKGDMIQAGQSRWYLVYYRDPTVLGGCPASSTFNATQTRVVSWAP